MHGCHIWQGVINNSLQCYRLTPRISSLKNDLWKYHFFLITFISLASIKNLQLKEHFKWCYMILCISLNIFLQLFLNWITCNKAAFKIFFRENCASLISRYIVACKSFCFPHFCFVVLFEFCRICALYLVSIFGHIRSQGLPFQAGDSVSSRCWNEKWKQIVHDVQFSINHQFLYIYLCSFSH